VNSQEILQIALRSLARNQLRTARRGRIYFFAKPRIKSWRAPVALILLTAGLFSSQAAWSQAKSSSPNLLQSFASDFWAWRGRYQPFSNDDIPRIEHPAGQRDWSAASIARQRAALADFETRWKEMDATAWSVPQQVDYRLMGSALARVRWELDINRRWERDPTFYLEQSLTAVLESLLQPPPFGAQRSREIVARMEEIPAILAAGKANLHPVRPFAQLAIGSLRQIHPELTEVERGVAPLLTADAGSPGDMTASFQAATEKAIAALESYRSWLQQHLAAMPEKSAIGRANYEFFLNNVALLPCTPAQLLAISREEWERSVAFEQFEQQRNQGLPELKIASTAGEQIRNSQRDELDIRKFLEERNILSVPQGIGHYTVQLAPAYLDALGDFGELDWFGGPTHLGEDGVRWIDPPSPNLGYFWLASAKDPRPDMIHEGVPGHFFQMSWSWMHDDPIRRHYYDSGANEGLGFYIEEMMMQAGLFDDSPRSREIIYNFMRLRALRVEVDVKLALGTFTMEQAAAYLQQYVPMDKKTAEEEASFFATTPGQAISYQIGKVQILGFLADAKLKQGSAFSLRAFHDYLWKNGNVPIALQHWEYLDNSDDIRLLDRRRSVRLSQAKH
jgi:uncharacterized protein (DUF885 family)